MTSDETRTTFRMQEKTLNEIKEQIGNRPYTTVSDWIRDAIDEKLARCKAVA